MKPKSMKTILLAALLAPGALFAQTTATTTPVGYVSLGNNGNIPASTDAYITIPLDREIIGQFVIATVSGSTLNFSGTPTLGSLSDSLNPHFAKIASGSNNGLFGLITANNSSSVTISLPSGDTLTGVAPGDKVILTKAWTVASLMGSSFPSGTQLLGYSGSFSGQNGSTDLIYEFDGSNWIDTNSFEAADNTVLYPGETLIVRNSSSSPITNFVVSGSVPTTNHRAIIVRDAGGSDNTQSYFSPVEEIIGNSGLSAIAAAGDQLLGFDNSAIGQNKAASVIIEFDGSAWIDTNSFDDVTTTFTLKAGAGYIFRRAAGSVGNALWTDVPTYLPSL